MAVSIISKKTLKPVDYSLYLFICSLFYLSTLMTGKRGSNSRSLQDFQWKNQETLWYDSSFLCLCWNWKCSQGSVVDLAGMNCYNASRTTFHIWFRLLFAGSEPVRALCSTSWQEWNPPRTSSSGDCHGSHGGRTGCWDGYSFIRASIAVWRAEYPARSSSCPWSLVHIEPKSKFCL